eukprot:13343859-Alexandrium_andersonii.AAC.1
MELLELGQHVLVHHGRAVVGGTAAGRACSQPNVVYEPRKTMGTRTRLNVPTSARRSPPHPAVPHSSPPCSNHSPPIPTAPHCFPPLSSG